MGKLIKNHWARLIIMTAATCTQIKLTSSPIRITTDNALPDQIAAALSAIFWPKFFFDFLTKNFDGAVKPIPILQTINLLLALITLAYEYPLKYVAGTALHKSIEARMLWLPLCCLASVLLYQGTNAGLYYLMGCGVYFWAFAEGEVSVLLLERWFRQRRSANISCRLCARYLGPYRSARIDDYGWKRCKATGRL